VGARSGDNGNKRFPRLRGKRRLQLRTLDDLDHRTRAVRRTRELVDTLISDLGGDAAVTVAVRQLVQRAALLGALIEDIEIRWVDGEPIPLVDYLTAINTQQRVLTALGLKRRPKDVTPTLDEYLKRRGKRANGKVIEQ
jgi:hypothetical protein